MEDLIDGLGTGLKAINGIGFDMGQRASREVEGYLADVTNVLLRRVENEMKEKLKTVK